jgi:hypothetical protein
VFNLSITQPSGMASPSLMSVLDQFSAQSSSDLLTLFADDKLTGACLEYLESALRPSPVVALPPPIPTRQSGGVMMCLASVLETLAQFDERTVFSVRKINKLGFKSYGVLRKYFSSFGHVEAIYFLPYRYKPDTASIRPSSMAFIRMGSPESVDRIFAIGETHLVRDVPVTVQKFTMQDTSTHT